MAFVSAAGLGLLATAGDALALSSEEMIQKAEVACLEAAAAQGWNKDAAKVVSSKALDTDKVEVVFDLTKETVLKEGVNSARLTCPYSVSQGVGSFGDRAAPATPAEPIADTGTPVNQSKAWWLLLPLGLGLASWAALRGRGEDAGTTYGTGTTSYGTDKTYSTGTTAYGTGATTGKSLFVEANAHDGQVEVREHADITSPILRRVRNGDSIQLTGHRRNDWLEVVNTGVSQGGWVRDLDVRYDRTTVRFT
ncbi:MAG TPA: SH3 domain-containing protein [Cyanobium sp.]|nr:SH3 domain-containing protein [Cyanobium sp.]